MKNLFDGIANQEDISSLNSDKVQYFSHNYI